MDWSFGICSWIGLLGSAAGPWTPQVAILTQIFSNPDPNPTQSQVPWPIPPPPVTSHYTSQIFTTRIRPRPIPLQTTPNPLLSPQPTQPRPPSNPTPLQPTYSHPSILPTASHPSIRTHSSGVRCADFCPQLGATRHRICRCMRLRIRYQPDGIRLMPAIGGSWV